MLLIYFVAGLAALVASALLMWKYPVAVAVTSVAAAAFCEVTDIGVDGLQFGIGIYPQDIACAVLLGACVVVCLRTRSLPHDSCTPAVILLGLSLLNFARGIATFGLKPAGNSLRGLVFLVLPAVAFSAMGAAVRITAGRLVNCLSLASLVLVAIAAGRWTGVLPMPEQLVGDVREVARVLPSDYAMIIGQALIGVIGIQLIRGFRANGLIIAGMFAAVVFALQHRSVWLATAAGLLWVVLRSPRLYRSEWLKVCSLVLLLASALVLVPLLASDMFERARGLARYNVQEVGQDDSTWAWRVEGYSEATQRVFANGLAEAALGPPSGGEGGLIGTASFASIAIHDRYVAVLAYYGVTGLLVLLAWLISTAMRLQGSAPISSRDPHARTNQVILEAILISILVFFVPYSGGLLEGSLLGALWLTSGDGRAGEVNVFLAPRSTVVLRHPFRAAVARSELEVSGLRSHGRRRATGNF